MERAVNLGGYGQFRLLPRDRDSGWWILFGFQRLQSAGMVPTGFMEALAMNKKTRGYTDLGICTVFLYLAAGVCFLAAILFVMAASKNEGRYFEGAFLSASFYLGLCLAYIAIAGGIRLAIHVADDLYMLRLIKVNEYAKHQKPVPPPKPEI